MAGTREQAQINGRKGGRPKGSTTKPNLKAYLSIEEVEKLVETARKKADEGDTTMMKFILDHIFGKAIQPTEISGKDGEPLQILFDKVFENKSESTRETKNNSRG